jgi:hypothetical protein
MYGSSSSSSNVEMINVQGFPVFFGIVLYAFEGIGLVCSFFFNYY